MDKIDLEKQVCNRTDPDLLLALDRLTEVIKELKEDTPTLAEIEATDVGNPQPAWVTLLLVVTFLLAVFCFFHAMNNIFSSVKETQQIESEASE